jgi:hypothetical protein
MEHFILYDVNTDMLRSLLEISMSVTKSETLNFTLSPDEISGIASNEADSIYKKWNVELSDIAKAPSPETHFPKLKCSIYKGDEFAKRILSYFGQLVNMKIYHDGREIKQIELFKLNESGKISLKINLLTAATSTAFVEYSKELVSAIFTPGSETRQLSFTINPEYLSQVSRLSKLSTNPEDQTKWITLYSDNGSLKATDNAFDIILEDEGFPNIEPFDIDKSLWALVDIDKYSAEVHLIENSKIFVLKSYTKNLTVSLVLLEKTDGSVDFDDFSSSNETFE